MYDYVMNEIEYDPAKREMTLQERGLDFADAPAVFAARNLTGESPNPGNDKVRYITIGPLRGTLVVIVWTPRGAVRRIISMRKANADIRKRFQKAVG